MQNKKDKSIRTSKIVMWIFIVLFIFVVTMGVFYRPENVVDTAVFCGCVTAVTTILGIVLSHYYNASTSENLPKIQTSLYKKTLDLRYEYDVKRAALAYEYGINKEDILDYESDFNIDEVNEGVLDQAVSELTERSVKAHQDIEPSSY